MIFFIAVEDIIIIYVIIVKNSAHLLKSFMFCSCISNFQNNIPNIHLEAHVFGSVIQNENILHPLLGKHVSL